MLWPNNERIYLQWINYAFIVYCCTPKALYNHGGGLSSTTTSVQHPLGWCDGCHRTTALVRSPHTGYRWRGERVIEPIRWMHSPHTSYRWRGERERESQSSGWGWLGGHDWQGPVVGIWPGHRCYTPTLYEKCHGIFNDHTVSGPRFNVSSERRVPVTILGR